MSDKSNITLPRPTVALIGLGTMGAGIAERLLDQGFPVDVWNRTPGPAARLTERGATAHAMPEQAAGRANVVLTMLPTGDAVKEVMLERNAALNAPSDPGQPAWIARRHGRFGNEAGVDGAAGAASRPMPRASTLPRTLGRRFALCRADPDGCAGSGRRT